MSTLTLAVISDLHVFQAPSSVNGQDDDPSILHISLPEDQPTKHPIVGLRRLITDVENLNADLLLCPGDIGDKGPRKIEGVN